MVKSHAGGEKEVNADVIEVAINIAVVIVYFYNDSSLFQLFGGVKPLKMLFCLMFSFLISSIAHTTQRWKDGSFISWVSPRTIVDSFVVTGC